jgi:hypothetical protein
MNLDQYNRLFVMLEVILHEQRELKRMSFDLSALVAQVAATQTAEQSAVLVIQSIAQEIQNALASDEADAKSQLTFLVGKLQDSANALGAAVATVPPANTVSNTVVSNTVVSNTVVANTDANTVVANTDSNTFVSNTDVANTVPVSNTSALSN